MGLTHSYAALLAKEGITVNAIAPALIETDMIRDNPRATSALIPVDRFGTVDEVADVVVMLTTQQLHHRPDDQRQRRLVHELIASDHVPSGQRPTGSRGSGHL